MLIFNEYNETVILDDLCSPITSEFFWVLDLANLDFGLAPLSILEETTSPTITIAVGMTTIEVPANWNILILDDHAGDIDIIPVSWIGHKSFKAFSYGPEVKIPTPVSLRLVDYKVKSTTIAPAMNKHQMLCHPITPNDWIVFAPNDGYSKYLKNTSMGDLIE